MPSNNSTARRDQRRDEARARNDRNREYVIACKCGRTHHAQWPGCPRLTGASEA